jgi:hypothetical protein
VTGWLLKPASPPAPVTPAAPASQRVLSGLDSRLSLTDAQKKQLAPLLTEWERELPPGNQNPRKRYELFTNNAPRIRAVLTTNQFPAYDRMVEEYQQKMARRPH